MEEINRKLNPIYCKCCGNAFTAEEIGKSHYVASAEKKSILSGEIAKILFDAFDCPVCKCQNILGERYKKHITLVSENKPDEVVFVEKENKTLCDKCNKQDKDCHCDCTREFEEKEIKNVPKCFGEKILIVLKNVN